MRPLACDVAVIGGGLSGLTCALRAALGGRTVVVLERSGEDRYLCNSRIATGVFHVAMNSVSLNVQTLEARVRDTVGAGAREDLVTALCRNAARAVAWLRESGGAQFIRGGDAPFYDHVLAPSTIGLVGRPWQGKGADALLGSLEQKLVGRGGRVLRGHAVRELKMQDGRCIGLAGEGFEAAARHVVIADGGYQGDVKLMKRISPAPQRLVQRNARSATGDGLRMALAAGAALADRGGFYGHLQSRSALTDDRLWPYPWADELARACIVVGADGKRIADERLGGVYLANRIAALPDPASAWVVCDQPAWDGPGAERHTSPNPLLERMGGRLERAPSIEALAAGTGIDAGGLAATIAQHNAGAPAWPIRTAPFHALPIVPGITYTFGGIAVDGDARALREDGTPIEGLYAVGSTAGGLEGGERFGYAGGLARAAVSGLLAAEHICR
jgi:fumarate reductase flavoprotein subunit